MGAGRVTGQHPPGCREDEKATDCKEIGRARQPDSGQHEKGGQRGAKDRAEPERRGKQGECFRPIFAAGARRQNGLRGGRCRGPEKAIDHPPGLSSLQHKLFLPVYFAKMEIQAYHTGLWQL